MIKKNIIASAVSAGLLATAAVGGTLPNDGFEDGQNPGWIAVGSTLSISRETAPAEGEKASLKAGAAGVVLVRSFDPQTVAVGESITVEWKACSAFRAKDNQMKFGLFNSGGSSDPAFENYSGYALFAKNTRAPGVKRQMGAVSIQKRSGSGNGLFAPEAFTQLAAEKDGFETMGNKVWTPMQQLTLTRTADGWFWQTGLGGLENQTEYPANGSSGTFADAAPVATFDTLAFWYSNGQPVFIDQIIVHRNPGSLQVPAPGNPAPAAPPAPVNPVPAAPPAPALTINPGRMTTLDKLASARSEVFQLSDTDRPGAWCWFQDPRAIVDNSNPAKPILLTGVVTYGEKGSEQRGDIDLYWAKLDSVTAGPLQRGRIELDDRLQMDDHASPSFMIRPDGRYLVNWSMHGNDKVLRTLISEKPGDPTLWSDTIEAQPTGHGITYTNPHYLADANNGKGVIFNGVRSRGFDSNFVLSDDLGLTWRYGGRTLDASDPWPDHPDGGRAYVKYAGDGKSKIHLFSTDDHPHVNFNEDRTARGDLLNSIYCAYIENNKLHRADGTVIDEDLSDDKAAEPPKMTLLLKDGTLMGADAMRRGWQFDLKTGPDGQPVGIFQFRANDNPDDHRYFYARYDGSTWHVNFLAYGGDNFGRSDQPDYTGLAAVDPSNPDVVYISTSSDPVTGSYLISSASGQRQHEIFMGRTSDFGATWTWAPLTQNSLVDNIRPIVPKWTAGKSVVLWMQGSYPSFYVYDTKIVGQIIDLQPTIQK